MLSFAPRSRTAAASALIVVGAAVLNMTAVAGTAHAVDPVTCKVSGRIDVSPGLTLSPGTDAFALTGSGQTTEPCSDGSTATFVIDGSLAAASTCTAPSVAAITTVTWTLADGSTQTSTLVAADGGVGDDAKGLVGQVAKGRFAGSKVAGSLDVPSSETLSAHFGACTSAEGLTSAEGTGTVTFSG